MLSQRRDAENVLRKLAGGGGAENVLRKLAGGGGPSASASNSQPQVVSGDLKRMKKQLLYFQSLEKHFEREFEAKYTGATANVYVAKLQAPTVMEMGLEKQSSTDSAGSFAGSGASGLLSPTSTVGTPSTLTSPLSSLASPGFSPTAAEAGFNRPPM